MPTNIAIRLQAEGGAQIKQELAEAGRAGETAFQGVATAADQAAAATDRLAKKTQEAAQAARTAQGAASGAGPTPSATTMREVERLRNRLDEEYRNATQRERVESIIGRGFSSGALDQAEADRLRRLAGERYGGSDNDNAPGRGGLSGGQRQDLMYQGSDVVASLGSGAGLGTVAFQQGPQILQGLAAGEGGLRGGLTALAESAKALVTPFTVAGTAVVAAAATFTLAASQYARDQSVLERATQGLGRSTGASVTMLNDLATANASAGKVSVSTAREFAASYASTGQVALPVIGDLISRTSEYARITGQDATSATADLARAFADPVAGADQLASKLGGLDDITRQNIVTLQEQGDRAGATAALMEVLKAQIEANAQSTSAWGSAWNFVSKAADGAWESVRRAAAAVAGFSPADAQALADVNRRLEEARKQASGGSFGFGQTTRLSNENVKRLEAERDGIQEVIDRTQKRAETEAFLATAKKDSLTAGAIARSMDPLDKTYDDLVAKQQQLNNSLDSPASRSKLADIDAVERTREMYTRAIDSMVDANGKRITSEELVRRQDQLKLDSIKAVSAAEKAAVAERKAELELIGKPLSQADFEGRRARAGLIASAEAASKGGAKKSGGGTETDAKDDYDRATRSIEDRIRRQEQESTTFGQGAEAVARYRTETELLTAAKRAERDITPALTAQIKDYADRAAEAARVTEQLRDTQRQSDQLNSAGRESFSGLFRDMRQGAGFAASMESSVSRMVDRLGDLASDQVFTALFGGRGTSGGSGALGGIFGGLFGGGGTAAAASSPGLSDFFGGNFFPAFAGGGYTGSGDRLAAAGIVHRGEYVFDKASTDRIGVGTLEMIRAGIRGYAEGGLVGGSPGRDRFTMPSKQAGGSAPVASPGKTELHVYAGEKNEVETSQGASGVRHDIMIDKAVARALLDGSSTKRVLKSLTGSKLAG